MKRASDERQQPQIIIAKSTTKGPKHKIKYILYHTMPAGPSQKGKFKPRKPARKARAAAVPDSTQSSSNTADSSGGPGSSNNNPQNANETATRGGADSSLASIVRDASSFFTGRGGGRGGRGGGRGRGRGPQPQGQAFFTAAPVTSGKKTAASKAGGSSSGSSRKLTGKREEATSGNSKLLVQKKDTEASEEIVGQLDSAIGSSFGKDGASARKSSKADDDYTEEPDTMRSSMFDDVDGPSRKLLPDECMYDSDSSAEEAKPRPKSNYLTPSILPFPVAPLPSGVGAKYDNERPKMYTNQRNPDTLSAETVDTTEGEIPLRLTAEKMKPSPFVDPDDFEAMRKEQDSFFLFQLPTRLPNLVRAAPNASATKREDGDGDSLQQQDATKAPTPTLAPLDIAAPKTTAEVATAPVNSQCFDNTLGSAIPGRLGKLVVYKSGKTVLLLQGPDGSSSEIRMNVTEGLTCGFVQQAVVIDPEMGRYVKLGSVHKTAVVSPDLERAFEE